MLKMKIDPAMCMKTQERMTKCLVKKQVFTRKCTHFTIIDNNLSGFLAENAQAARKFGAKADPKSAHRFIIPSIHRRSTELVSDGPMSRWPDPMAVSGEKEINLLTAQIAKPKSQIASGRAARLNLLDPAGGFVKNMPAGLQIL
jgi:hypothetical protein